MLAERLNISGQAVSKWENNLAQPDLDTIIKLTEIFEISLNQFTALCEVGDMVATPISTEDSSAPIETTVEEPMPATPPPPMLIGVCAYCGTSLYNQKDVAARTPKLMCARCKATFDKKKKQEAERAVIEKAQKHARQISRLKKTLIIPGIIVGILMIIGISLVPSQFIYTILGSIFLYAIIVQIIWDNNWIAGIFHGTFGWTFAKPGLIIPLSLDGFLWALCVKIAMAIIWFLISCAVTFAGLALCALLTPFVLPFAIRTTVYEIKIGTFE